MSEIFIWMKWAWRRPQSAQRAWWAGFFTVLCVTTALGSSLGAQTTIMVPDQFTTIQAGIDAANNGDVVLVSPGIYHEHIDFKGKAITVTSGAKAFSDMAVAETVIESSGDGPIVTFETNEQRTAVLNGLTLTNGTTTAVYVSDSSATISNNVIDNNHGCGIVVSGANASPLIQANQISNTGNSSTCGTPILPFIGVPTPATAITLLDAGDVVVEDNTIERNGVVLPFSQGNVGGVIAAKITRSVRVQNNIIRNNITESGKAPLADDVLSLFIVQNLIYGNTSSGSAGIEFYINDNDYPPSVPVASRTMSAVVINNTVYGNIETNAPTGVVEGEQFYILGQFLTSVTANNLFISSNDKAAASCGDGAESTVNFTRNDVLNEGQKISTLCGSSISSEGGSLVADPLFRNVAAGDFHTQRTSPVVAAGSINVAGIPATDLDGKARSVCGTIDMGVYEVHPQPLIALTSSPNPSTGGSGVLFTATLSGNCNVPTGVVTFLDGSTLLGTSALNESAIASLSTAGLTVGIHNITATYPGDFNFDPSTSNPVVQVVTGYPTTTTLQVSPNPTTALQAITLSSTVSSKFGKPNGTVSFFAGVDPLGTATLPESGFATMSVSTLGAGTYNVTAVYQATTDYAASRSPIVVEVVNGAATTATLVSAPNPSTFGQDVMFTANVLTDTSAVATKTTGTVSFFDGTTSLNTTPLGSSGSASFSTASLALGNHSIKAVYSGSTNDNASSSNVVVQVVVPAATSMGLTASPNPANFGQIITFTADVRTAIAGLSSPQGTIVFADQFGPLGSAPLAGGQAVYTTSSLPVGTHNVVATFAGSPGFAASSAMVAEVVRNFDFTLGVMPSALVIPSGDYEDLSVTLTPVGGFNGIVGLSCASMPIHSECGLSSGSVTLAAGIPQTVTLTINTSDLRGYGDKVGKQNRPESLRPFRTFPILSGILLPALLLPGIRRRPARLLTVLVVMAGLLSSQGCSGKLPGKTPPGVYSITLEGSGATISHSVTLSLKVTP